MRAIRWQKGGNREGKEGGETRREEKSELTPQPHQGRERECLTPQLGFRPVWQQNTLSFSSSLFFFFSRQKLDTLPKLIWNSLCL